jgi:hypothetical protein
MNENKTPSSKQDASTPKFGRLLIVLFLAVMLIVLITVGSEAYYSH